MQTLFEFEKKVDKLRKKIEELKSMGRFDTVVVEEIEKKFLQLGAGIKRVK